MTLRHVYPDDLPLILAWRSDREVMRYLPSTPKEPTWEQTVAWFRRDKTHWVVEYDKRPVGTAHAHTPGEVGILIGEKSLWGQGIGKRALVMMMDMALRLLPVHKPLFAVIHPENERSKRLFASCGFENTHEPERNGQERWVLSETLGDRLRLLGPKTGREVCRTRL